MDARDEEIDSSEYDETSGTDDNENLKQSGSANPQSNSDELVKQIKQSIQMNQTLLNKKNFISSQESLGSHEDQVNKNKSNENLNFNENFLFDSQENFEYKSKKEKGKKMINNYNVKKDMGVSDPIVNEKVVIVTDKYENISDDEN